MSMRVEASVGLSTIEARSETLLPEEPSSRASGTPKTDSAHGFQRVITSLGREIDKGEALVQRALTGASHFSAADLIALQAGIYRYSEAVDLAAKFVDRAAGTIRTTLQGSG